MHVLQQQITPTTDGDDEDDVNQTLLLGSNDIICVHGNNNDISQPSPKALTPSNSWKLVIPPLDIPGGDDETTFPADEAVHACVRIHSDTASSNEYRCINNASALATSIPVGMAFENGIVCSRNCSKLLGFRV